VFGPPGAGMPGFIQSNRNAPGDLEVVVRTSDGRLNHLTRHDGFPWRGMRPGTWLDRGRFAGNVQFSGPSLVQARHVSALDWTERYADLHVVAVLTNQEMEHWTLVAGQAWTSLGRFAAGIASPPCMIEGQFGMGNEVGQGNFELCVAVSGQVQHWWRHNSGDGAWHQSATFAHDVAAVTGLLQGSFGGNLELIVLRTDEQMQHYWRDGVGWHEGAVIGPA
jgi:hypothetical protein